MYKNPVAVCIGECGWVYVLYKYDNKTGESVVMKVRVPAPVDKVLFCSYLHNFLRCVVIICVVIFCDIIICVILILLCLIIFSVERSFVASMVSMFAFQLCCDQRLWV